MKGAGHRVVKVATLYATHSRVTVYTQASSTVRQPAQL